MSDESYRILTNSESQKYFKEDWFKDECWSIYTKAGLSWVIPEKYVLKDLDKKSYYRTKLQELLDDFDFEKVNIVMNALDWVWVGVCGTPEKEDMIPIIKKLYEDIEERILNDEFCYAATGGFMLTFKPYEDHELSLVFEAVNYSVYGD